MPERHATSNSANSVALRHDSKTCTLTSSSGGLPFLITHPASAERIENMKRLAAESRR